MSKKVSLSEIMGRSGASKSESGLKLEHLQELLGDSLPELPKNAVGRFRLIRSLQQRFGKNFRSLPGVGDLIKQFDGDLEFEKRLQKIRSIKAGK